MVPLRYAVLSVTMLSLCEGFTSTVVLGAEKNYSKN